MASKEEIMAELSTLLNRLNSDPKPESALRALLKHPILVTTIGSLFVVAGTNWVTKQFQLRDKQAESIVTVEVQVPKQLSLTYRMAQIASVLEDEECYANQDKVLKYPLIIGLTGKTCGEAEQEFNHYYQAYLHEPPAPALSRMRAIFSSSAVDDGAKKLSILLGVLGSSTEAACIVNVHDQLQQGYDTLLELALAEIDGNPSHHVHPVFALSTSLKHCTDTPVCKIPAVAADSDMKSYCVRSG